MEAFYEALGSVKRNSIVPEEQDLFGRLVGEWDLEWIDNRMGYERHVKGEWIFARVLDGTAIQDVFIVPSRAEREKNPQPDAEYGTTIRIYNPATAAWDVFYGCTGEATRLEARKAEEGIEITENTKGSMKWVFSEIQEDSFHWQNRRTEDGGATWQVKGELFAKRRK